MKWNKYGEQVEDNDPEGIYDEAPVNPEARPSNPAPANVVDPAVIAAYQQQLLAESNARAQLQRELDEARRVPTPAPTAEQERAFFDAPIKTTRELIAEEMQRAVAPINATINGFARQQTYGNMKEQMRASGNFPYLPKIETIFDQAMTNIEPTVQNMTQAYQSALGFFISNGGRLEEAAAPTNNDRQTPAAPVNTNKPLPPHARPTPPSNAPARGGNTAIRALNENEKILMRHNGYKHPAQYLFWTEHIRQDEVGHITPEQEKARIKEIFGVDI